MKTPDVSTVEALEYLSVDRFLADVVGAGALQSALNLGLIDRLLQDSVLSVRSFAAQANLDEDAAGLLLGMLRANAVIEECPGGIRLSMKFRNACRYRELMEAKLEFAAWVAPDFLQRFTTLLADPTGFFEQANIFKLFSYDRCLEVTTENLAATRRWMRFTTALTHCEAGVCRHMHDFSSSRHLLDVGGNSGEFALQLCKWLPDLKAAVLDLPVVCEIGATHVATEPEASRIEFHKTSGANQVFPSGFDTVCFKSMLHDWPDEQMVGFLRRAYDALDVGGTLLIFERGKIETGPTPMPYSLIPILLFFRAYRTSEDYLRELERIGFRDLHCDRVTLDVPFMMIRARK
jgi:hypothetical protein